MSRDVHPPPLPEMADVPLEALDEPYNYVRRPGLQDIIDLLVDPAEGCAPFAVVGMPGGGKTVLASAVVRDRSVREHFCGGIFWRTIGRGAKNRLLPDLRCREMGATRGDASHGTSRVRGSLDQVNLLGIPAVSRGSSPRLVVLDDVWEPEVVDAFLSLGVKVLATTRDQSVVRVPGEYLKVESMSNDEAVELLLKTSMVNVQPGDHIRTRLREVRLCYCA